MDVLTTEPRRQRTAPNNVKTVACAPCSPFTNNLACCLTCIVLTVVADNIVVVVVVIVVVVLWCWLVRADNAVRQSQLHRSIDLPVGRYRLLLVSLQRCHCQRAGHCTPLHRFSVRSVPQPSVCAAHVSSLLSFPPAPKWPDIVLDGALNYTNSLMVALTLRVANMAKLCIGVLKVLAVKTGFLLVLKLDMGAEKVLIFASLILKNQDTESVIFSSNICA